MGLCRPSDITTINMSQSCVKLYECAKFGTNIVGEMCTNSVTWFCATCYIYINIKKCWVMGSCCPSDITTINMSQSCVKLYERAKFGTNIVGEMCTNSVTWFCAYLCKTEGTMNYACCNIWCTTCSLLWPLSANISKSAQVFIFC